MFKFLDKSRLYIILVSIIITILLILSLYITIGIKQEKKEINFKIYASRNKLSQ